MDKRYLIFVSSTFSDLKEERRKVMEQILNMGHFPVGMELFQASNKDQWSYIERRIKDCDYYLLIVGERYGSVADDNLSYTEKEFDLALASGVPISAHLISHKARQTVTRDKVENGKEAEISAFRKKCEDGRIVKYWGNENELALNVTNALNEQFREEPRVGLVRGDQIASAQLANELARISSENAALRNKLELLDGQVSPKIQELFQALTTTFVRNYFDPRDHFFINANCELNLVIFEFARAFGGRASKGAFRGRLQRIIIIKELMPEAMKEAEDRGSYRESNWQRFFDGIQLLQNALLLIGLLQVEHINDGEGGIRVEFVLTELGREYLTTSTGVSTALEIGKFTPFA